MSHSMLKSLMPEEAGALLDACPLPVLLLDAAGCIRGCNRAFAALIGADADTGHEAPEDLQKEGLLEPFLSRGTLVNWVTSDGDERWLSVESLTPVGSRGYTARFYHDVTDKLRLVKERDALVTQLKQHTLRDEALPALMNRRGVMYSLEPMVARCRRYASPLSVIAMGIDMPPEQEKLRVRIGHLLRDQTRWADLLGCNDNQDFLLVLQETTRESALLLVDKLRVHLAHLGTGGASPASACYGITDCRRDDDAECLLERAEAALVKARKGQNGSAICL